MGSGRKILIAVAGTAFLVGMKMIFAERYNLRGRVVVITGGSRGLGLALARSLARKGAKLVICARSLDQLENAQQELLAMGAEVVAVQCDVTDSVQVEELMRTAVNSFGKIDILINNAGIIQVGPMSAMTELDYRQAMDTHFWAPLYTTVAALPYFREQQEGRIVNIASIGGKIAVPHLLPYSASKFALVGLSEGLAVELRKENIRVFTIAPSLMRTGSPRNITVKGNHEKEYAWFKTGAALSLISEQPANVASKIIDALETNNTHPAISSAERVAAISKEIFPQTFEKIFSQINRVMPRDVMEGYDEKKGYESESFLSRNLIARGADVDATKNNEN